MVWHLPCAMHPAVVDTTQGHTFTCNCKSNGNRVKKREAERERETACTHSCLFFSSANIWRARKSRFLALLFSRVPWDETDLTLLCFHPVSLDVKLWERRGRKMSSSHSLYKFTWANCNRTESKTEEERERAGGTKENTDRTKRAHCLKVCFYEMSYVASNKTITCQSKREREREVKRNGVQCHSCWTRGVNWFDWVTLCIG